jgi:hypothetical protein
MLRRSTYTMHTTARPTRVLVMGPKVVPCLSSYSCITRILVLVMDPKAVMVLTFRGLGVKQKVWNMCSY